MKNVFAAILLFTLSFNGFAQCFPERHNTTWFNQWISCEKTENPNTTRPESHWIMYDFGTELKMYTLNIWNINAPDLLSDGIQKANIDYSSDGVTWFEYGEVTFNQGTGKNTYEGQEVLNFNGAVAKYLLITSEISFAFSRGIDTSIRLSFTSIKFSSNCFTELLFTTSFEGRITGGFLGLMIETMDWKTPFSPET